MIPTLGYAAHSSTSPLERFAFSRREVGPKDVRIAIRYCGVCHSDLHQVRNEWSGSTYPIVPGHEIVGEVVAIGSEVKKIKVGERAGVGCMVDSCRVCAECAQGLEQYCEQDPTYTYNSPDPHGGTTYGGYSKDVVVDEHFVLRLAPSLDYAASAPLLCAGITTYSPLRHWQVGPGQRVGIVGLGGLGHMGLKFAHAFGAEVTLFTTTPGKESDAKRLGADEVVISKNDQAMQAQSGRFDFILDTVGARHHLDAYLSLLKRDGTLCLVGLPEKQHPMPHVGFFLSGRKRLSGSSIGGIAETQEMLDFCAQHNIVSDIELIPMPGINDAYERMLKSDVKYRFVLDLDTLK